MHELVLLLLLFDICLQQLQLVLKAALVLLDDRGLHYKRITSCLTCCRCFARASAYFSRFARMELAYLIDSGSPFSRSSSNLSVLAVEKCLLMRGLLRSCVRVLATIIKFIIGQNSKDRSNTGNEVILYHRPIPSLDHVTMLSGNLLNYFPFAL